MKAKIRTALALGLICAASAGQRPIDGEIAMQRFEAFLRRGGITQKLEIESLSQTSTVPYYAKTKLWQVGMRSGRDSFSCSIDELGRVRYYSARLASRSTTTTLSRAQAEQKAWQMLDRLGKHPPVYLEDAQQNGPEIFAQFKISTSGKPLFNYNPLYGYILRFTPDGKLIYLIDEAETLRPNASQPKVSERAATALLSGQKEVAQAKEQGAKFVLATHATWGMKLELGYYKLPGEPTARLVYRGILTQTISGHTGEHLRVPALVDAITGKLFTPDYNSSER